MQRDGETLSPFVGAIVGGVRGRATRRSRRRRAALRARKPGRLMSAMYMLLGAPEKDPGGVIPTAIYTALPHLYVLAGVLTFYLLRNSFAAFSAFAWVSAACIIWVRRYQYRAPFIRSGGRIDLPTVIDDEGTTEETIQILWKSSFECGHALLDAQHRRLFGLGNELVKAVVAKKLPGDIAWLLDVLINHITDHSCAEEAVLAKARHPVCKEHQELHRALLNKAVELRNRYGHGEVLTSDLVGFIVRDVITDHIAKEAVEFNSLWSSRHSRIRRRRRSSRPRAPSTP